MNRLQRTTLGFAFGAAAGAGVGFWISGPYATTSSCEKEPVTSVAYEQVVPEKSCDEEAWSNQDSGEKALRDLGRTGIMLLVSGSVAAVSASIGWQWGNDTFGQPPTKKLPAES